MKRLLCFVLSAVLIFSLTACDRNNTDIDKYEDFASGNDFLPELSELGRYSSVKCLNHKGASLIFEWEAYNLIVEYAASDYESAKAAVKGKYIFETKMIESERYVGGKIDTYDDDWVKVTYPPYCTMEGYQLHLLKQGGSIYVSFPKTACFVGFNDEAHKLAYVYFEDIDLDSAESLVDFLSDECGWDELIKRDML